MAKGNGFCDRVAISGVGLSPYSRRDSDRSIGMLTLEACMMAIRDAGLGPGDIDGLCGSRVSATYVQTALGIPEATWWCNLEVPFVAHLINAAAAIHAGVCHTALVYHSAYRTSAMSKSAAADPMRRHADIGMADLRAFFGTGHVTPEPGSLFGSAAYAAWAGRYLHDHGRSREVLGLIAVNGRSHAARNDNAVLRSPLTMAGYLQARMVREPLCLLDMDIPVDGADAFVLTSAARGRDLGTPPVLIHAASMGQTAHADEDQLPDLDTTGQSVALARLWERSEIRREAVDLLYPYDGFTIIAVKAFESAGFCGNGEAADFLAGSWDDGSATLLIDGRVGVNTHGGSLSEGATQGSGHVREAVMQLRGAAGERQQPGARSALVTAGGFFFNSQAMLLRAGD